jgi:hypothetical protein
MVMASLNVNDQSGDPSEVDNPGVQVMRITHELEAIVTDDNTGDILPVPVSLDGWVHPDEPLECYLDEELAEQGITGGVVRFSRSDEGLARILVDYWAPHKLDDISLEALRAFTKGQMSDGMGEQGFPFEENGTVYRVQTTFDEVVRTTQWDDGKRIPAPSRLAIAARRGDLVAVEARIRAQDAIDVLLQGYTALHFAILYAHADIALRLIEAGADPNRTDPQGGRPLAMCAASRELTDDNAEKIARALLGRGAIFDSESESGMATIERARQRLKHKFLAVLLKASQC